EPVLFERILASLGSTPLHFIATVEPLPDDEVDLFVVGARHVGGLARGGVPVIAQGPAGFMRSAFLGGCADYLRDPWTPEELALRVQAAIARQRACFEFP